MFDWMQPGWGHIPTQAGRIEERQHVQELAKIFAEKNFHGPWTARVTQGPDLYELRFYVCGYCGCFVGDMLTETHRKKCDE